MGERTAGLKASHDQDSRARAGQARPAREETHASAFAAALRSTGGGAFDLGVALEAASPSARAELLSGLQRSRGNVYVQRLLAAQRQFMEEEEVMMDGGGASGPIGFALPEEDYWGGGAGASGSTNSNPLARIWSGITGAQSEWRGGTRGALKAGVSALGDAASQYGGGVRGAFGSLVGGLGEAGSALWNGVPGSEGGLEEDVLARLGAAGSALGGGIGGAASQLGSGVIGAASELWGGTQDVASNLWGGAQGAAGEIGSAASDIWDYFT